MSAPPPFRVVFMGTPAFAVPSLKVVASAERVTLVLCNPDRPSGRGRLLAAPPVKTAAEALGIPVFQPEKARSPESVERIAAEKPDLIVVVAYGHILPKAILDIPRIYCVNVHASLLPGYRGAAPINWAIARGETRTGVTIMRMDVGMDTGPMLLARELPIGPDDTAETMYPRLADLGAQALGDALRALHDGTLRETPQDDALATSAPMLKKEHGRIDWSRPAREVRDLVRGMTPWPSAHTFAGGTLVKILQADVCEARGAPGEIVAIGRDGVVAACGGGDGLRIRLIQPEGGKPMPSWAWAQGRRVAKGDALS